MKLPSTILLILLSLVGLTKAYTIVPEKQLCSTLARISKQPNHNHPVTAGIRTIRSTRPLWETISGTEEPHVETILFVECGRFYNMQLSDVTNILFSHCINTIVHFPSFPIGFGADSHGQNATKAGGKRKI